MDKSSSSLNKNFDEKIIKVYELSNNRLGVLFKYSLNIYSLIDLRNIDEIKLNEEYKTKSLINFLELRNFDIILRSSKYIHFYQFSKQKYEIYQIIREGKEKKSSSENDYDEEDFIHQIVELKNGNLVSCNSLDIKIYYKQFDKYHLQLKIKINDVVNAIEIKSNTLFLLHRHIKERRSGCIIDEYFFFSFSFLDVMTGKRNELFEDKTECYEPDLNFIFKNNYLLISYENTLLIYNKNKLELINKYISNKVKEEKINFIIFCNYFDNFFLVKDINGIIKVYTFDNESIEYQEDFSFQNKKGIILKNNKIIMNSTYNLEIIDFI